MWFYGAPVSGFESDPMKLFMGLGMICAIVMTWALVWAGVVTSVGSLNRSFNDELPLVGNWLATIRSTNTSERLELFGVELSIAAVVAAIAAAPVAYLLIPGMIRNAVEKMLHFLRIVSFQAAVIGVAALAYAAVRDYIPGWLLAAFFGLLAVAVVGSTIVLGGISVWDRTVALIADRRRLSALRTKFDGTRVGIAEALTSLKTVRGRLIFLRWLDDQQRLKEIAEKLRSPDNAWPAGRRPNWGNDEASEYLAILDERWLGLQQRS